MNSESNPPSSAAPYARRVPVLDVSRVPSGSPATVALRGRPHGVDAPGLALLLAERGLSLRAARIVATRLFDDGFAVAVLPRLDDWDRLRRDLNPLEVTVAAYGPPDRIDVRRLRELQGLTQEEFAAAFGLDLSTLRNWEQGRSEPDRASRSLLRTIAANPGAIREALARVTDQTLP